MLVVLARFQLFSQSQFQHYITLDRMADSEKSTVILNIGMRQSKYICQSLRQGYLLPLMTQTIHFFLSLSV